ncbi:MAG TPA: lamin tail domain-containing protein [Candidatus Thermoplasmatota archaeon]|nr:lamin tail domain-containing protein [Candidatus Thermoplasmatota archaeon]
MVSLPTPTVGQDAPSGLRLSELLADPATGEREFVEVWNPTSQAVDLAGWRISDGGTVSPHTFGAVMIPAGGRVVVWSGGEADARGPRWSASASSTIWNNGGDSATLLDPAGNVVDWFAYGTGAVTPPPGFSADVRPAAPAKGSSLALRNGAWSAGTPSPGLAPDAQGGSVAVTVENVAPTALFEALPETATPAESVTVRFQVHDGNGDGDVASWRLEAAGATVASGAAGGVYEATLQAPGQPGPWPLRLVATDHAEAEGVATAELQVRSTPLAVVLPAGGSLHFPPLKPGDKAVESLDALTLRNLGTTALAPRLDVSPFSGPQASIPVEGNLEMGLTGPGGATVWVPYVGPLTPLPEIAAGAELAVHLRIREVPSPLPAGAYGTSFTVVA